MRKPNKGHKAEKMLLTNKKQQLDFEDLDKKLFDLQANLRAYAQKLQQEVEQARAELAQGRLQHLLQLYHCQNQNELKFYLAMQTIKVGLLRLKDKRFREHQQAEQRARQEELNKLN